MKVKKLTLKNDGIPKRLRIIPQPPAELYVLGDLDPLLEMPTVSVVGSRKISSYGRQVTQKFTEELARLGVVIVSGLALGVDSVAHEACLSAGGKTIAVLPTGLDTIYPSSHRSLAKRILEQGGVLLSEYPLGTPGYKQNFIERNRLVSGLGDGILIPEAAIKSGTLHTANFALDQGKPVMAVPGNITSETSGGTNNLLKSGATLVTEVDDILQAMNLEQVGKQKQLPLAANEAEQIILDLITAGTQDASLLLAGSGLTPSEFNQTLSMLEITGKIHPVGGGNWAIR